MGCDINPGTWEVEAGARFAHLPEISLFSPRRRNAPEERARTELIDRRWIFQRFFRALLAGPSRYRVAEHSEISPISPDFLSPHLLGCSHRPKPEGTDRRSIRNLSVFYRQRGRATRGKPARNTHSKEFLSRLFTCEFASYVPGFYLISRPSTGSAK